ncbi:MAG: PAS domain-containing protein, partial [Ktedonobacterales bacterium]
MSFKRGYSGGSDPASQPRPSSPSGAPAPAELAATHSRHAAATDADGGAAAAPPAVALAARAAELEAVFQAVPDRIAIFDRDGAILRLNSAAHQQAGQLRGGEALGQVSAAYGLRTLAGQPFPVEQLPIARALRGETVSGVEMRTRGPNGEDELMLTSAAPIVDTFGAVQGAVAIAHDITALREAQRSTAEHASRLDAIFAAIADVVHVYDREGHLTQTNAAAQEFDARMRDPVYLAHSFDHRVSSAHVRDAQGNDLPAERLPAARVLRGEVLTGSQSVDTWIHVPDGHDVLLNTTGAPVKDAHGEVVGAVIVSRDVTERRRLEWRTRESLDALLTMAELLVDLPNRAEVGKNSDDGGNLPAVAQRLAQLTARVLGCERVSITTTAEDPLRAEPLAVVGLSAEQERQWRASVPSLVPGDYLDIETAERLLGGQPVIVEFTRRRKRGHPAYGAAKTLVLPLCLHGRYIGSLSVGYGATPHDYTADEVALASAVAQLTVLVLERERLLREREVARASVLALEEANRRMDEFLGIASHELRTPLTTLKANLQIAARRVQQLAQATDRPRAEADTELVVALHAILARANLAADRQSRLVNDLLDVSRIQAGELEMRPAVFDLRALVAACVEEARLAAPTRRIEQAPCHVDALPVFADDDRINQVVANFLSNALKYSSPHTLIVVSLAARDGHARVSVRDRGPGLPPDEVPRVWERFLQVPGNAMEHGT